MRRWHFYYALVAVLAMCCPLGLQRVLERCWLTLADLTPQIPSRASLMKERIPNTLWPLTKMVSYAHPLSRLQLRANSTACRMIANLLLSMPFLRLLQAWTLAGHSYRHNRCSYSAPGDSQEFSSSGRLPVVMTDKDGRQYTCQLPSLDPANGSDASASADTEHGGDNALQVIVNLSCSPTKQNSTT